MIDNNTFGGCTVMFHTFGCKLNFAESSTLGKMLAQKGVRRVHAGEIPDICIINTCSVTEVADKKCRQEIRKLIKKYPDALIAVTGCYAQLKSKEISQIEGVDIVVGSQEKLDLVNFIEQWMKKREQIRQVTPTKDINIFNPSCSRGDRTRYFLKVQDGCDYFCTYCTIPLARGKSRSGSIESLVGQARGVASEGGKEIVITGVNIGDFGKNTGEKFIDLIKALDNVDGIERYRISSIEPDLLTNEIIEFVAQSRAFMPHFHIPLQSGTDEVLALMRRHYDTALFANKIEIIKKLIPHAFIGVDVIAGARGETPALFEQSYKFIESLDITRLHVFPYSERPNTKALMINSYVSSTRDKSLMANKLISLSEQKLKKFTQQFIGTERPVLWEQPQKGKPMHGFTDNYLRVEAPYEMSLINTITPANLISVIDDECTLSATVK